MLFMKIIIIKTNGPHVTFKHNQPVSQSDSKFNRKIFLNIVFLLTSFVRVNEFICGFN